MASSGAVKEECLRPLQFPVKVEPEYRATNCSVNLAPVVEISSSSSDASRSHGDLGNVAGEVTSPPVSKRSSFLDNQNADSVCPAAKRPRIDSLAVAQTSSRRGPDTSLPHDFLQPLDGIRQSSPSPQAAMPRPASVSRPVTQNAINKPFRQFWKAGDYEGNKTAQRSRSGGMDHVRVHPKFLHSNATSHKWALGAVAELLDNSLDEVVHGATFVRVDMVRNPKNDEPMLLIEDDGGGMNPDSMRQCMSLGYSVKSKIANTIGQYGNGFKTSTMRLGADVVVFSRCPDNKGLGQTESVGMLSYTFLRETGQEDIIVPMIDYEIKPFGLKKLIRSNLEDWNRNIESIKCWSPYGTETELMDQFKGMKKQGTKIVLFNLWEDDQGHLELDFDTDRHDIQLRGVNRDENHISMAERFPNSRHYLTYQHSLRSYASILYLKLPPGFRMFLRGKEVRHHNLVDDLMFTEVWTYKPVASDVQTDTGHMKAVVTVGFVKDAKEHIDVQGFNVYHKNRLIKPFWRIWNSAASRGRGIIGVLEANFVEPAHDKQGFERTIVLARLEARLVEMQKQYWSKHCHKVGYVNIALKRKEGKAAEPKGTASAVEAIQPTAVTPLSLAPPARPPPVEASRPAMHIGYAPGAEKTPIPAGVVRSVQLQAQVHVSRQEHGVKEVAPQVLRQVSSQAVPVQLGSVGMPSQRHNLLMGTHTGPVNSPSGQIACTQLQGRVPFHNATRSPLPPPPISRVSMLRADAVRRVPSSGAQTLQVSQTVDTNHVSPMAQTLQSNAGDIGGLLSSAQNPSGHGTSLTGDATAQPPALPSLPQNSSVHSTHSTGDARSLSPGTVIETLRPAVRSSHAILRDNAATQSFTTSPVHSHATEQPISFINHAIPSTQSITASPHGGGAHSHAVQQPNSSIDHVMPSTLDASSSATQIVEGSKSPATGVSVAGGQEQQADEQNMENAQAPPSATSGIVSTSQPVVQESVEGSLQGESNRVEDTHSPISAHLSGPPCASPEVGTNAAQTAQLPPEHSPWKVSRLTNKESMPVRKSLEDLGRSFAKKAASVTMNEGEQSKELKGPENIYPESAQCVKSIVRSVTSKDLEVHLVEMEEEVKNLQQRLNGLKVERDTLRHQLLEERLRGQQSKRELQERVEQTWAKVRELEARNARLQLTEGTGDK